MIQKLILENWRSHKHTEIEFTKGTNVIVGQMGSGKTSLMDAICFAFYGTFPSLQARKIKLDDVIKNKPEQEKTARIKLFFNLNGENYEIKREIELGKGTTAEIRKEGLQIAGPKSQRVTEEVEKILQVNYELYSRAVYAEQNNIDYFLEITKSQRKQKIDELLQISKFEKAKKTLTQVINRLKERKKEKEENKKDEEEIQDIPELEKEIQEQKQKQMAEEKQLEKIQEEYERIKGEYEEEKKKKQDYEEKSKQLTELKGKEQYVGKKLLEKKEPEIKEEEAREEYEKIKKEKEKAKEQKEKQEQLKRKKEAIETKIELNSRKENELQEKIAQIIAPEGIADIRKQKEQAIQNYQEELNKTSAEKTAKKQAVKEVEGTIEEVNANEKCPVCESKLTAEKKNEIIKIKKEKIKGLEEEIISYEKKEEQIKKEVSQLKEEIEKIKAEEKKLLQKKFYEEELEKTRQEKEIYLKELETTKSELDKIEIKKDYEELLEEEQKIKEAVEYFEIKKEAEKIKELITKIEKEKNEIDYKEEREKELFEKLKKEEMQAALIKQSQANLKELIEEKERRLKNLLKIRKENKINSMQLEYLSKQIDSLQLLQNVLQDTQSKLREEFIESTNIALNTIWSKIYPYKDYVELKLDIDNSGGYLLMLKTTSGKWVNADGITSGGERSSASLALRIAFSLVLTKNLSWLVLDEPTHNLDKQAINELAITLKEHLPSLVEQIFLITHETELEKASTKNIYKLERNKETEEETRVTIEQIN